MLIFIFATEAENLVFLITNPCVLKFVCCRPIIKSDFHCVTKQPFSAGE